MSKSVNQESINVETTKNKNLLMSDNDTISDSDYETHTKKITKFEQKDDPDVEKNTDYAVSFYKIDDVMKYDKKKVLYIAAVGKYKGKRLFKCGITDNIYTRDYEQHRKTFGQQFKIIFVSITENNVDIERIVKKTSNLLKLNVKLLFNYKLRTELFVIDGDFTIEQFIDMIKNAVFQFEMKNSSELKKMIKLKEIELKIKDKETEQLKIKTEAEIQNFKIKTEAETKRLELRLKEKILESPIENAKLLEQIINKEIIAVNKTENKTENDAEEKNIYKRFLDECTIDTDNADDKIHTYPLYLRFEDWFKTLFPVKKIPSTREFVKNIRIYKDVEEGLRIGNNVRRGLRKIKFVDEE